MKTNVDRITALERRLHRTQALCGLLFAVVAICAAFGFSRPDRIVSQDEIRVERIIVVDNEGRPRIRLGTGGQRDPGEPFGIFLFDEDGAERFGVGTWPDRRVSMGFDAPQGVGGSPMRDRLALEVGSEGHAAILMLNNDTTAPVRFSTSGEHEAFLDFVDWDRSADEPRVRGFQRYGLRSEYVHVPEQQQ